MTGLGRIERYVVGYTLLGVLIWLAILSSVVVLIQFVELSGQVGTRADVGASSILQLTMLRVPSLMALKAGSPSSICRLERPFLTSASVFRFSSARRTRQLVPPPSTPR